MLTVLNQSRLKISNSLKICQSPQRLQSRVLPVVTVLCLTGRSYSSDLNVCQVPGPGRKARPGTSLPPPASHPAWALDRGRLQAKGPQAFHSICCHQPRGLAPSLHLSLAPALRLAFCLVPEIHSRYSCFRPCAYVKKTPKNTLEKEATR